MLLLAPVSGALTYPAPHALRDAVSIPFLLLLATYGLTLLRDLAPRIRQLALGAVVLATVVQGAFYLTDLYGAYPVRAAGWFDTGVIPAVRTAVSAAAGHTVWLADDLEVPYIEAAFALLPVPPKQPTEDAQGYLLAEMHMQMTAPGQPPDATAGDIEIEPAQDGAPPASTLIETENGPQNPLMPGTSAGVIAVYRLGG